MMNNLVLVFTFVLMTLEATRSIETRNNTVAKVNLLNNLNRQLHNISVTLFKALKLHKNFTNVNKNNTLIKTADDLIELSETKFKMYKEIHNATKTEIDNKAINPLFNLTQVIEEIFKEEHYFLRNNEFLRNDSFIEFYEAVVSNANWLEKSLVDWESVDNNTYNEYRRRGVTKVFRRKYGDKINELLTRRRMDDLPPWRAPNETTVITRRIFGSNPTHIKKFPFMASLLLMKEFVCAASIISKDMVLTAASCLQLAYKNPNFLEKKDAVSVRVGSDYSSQGGEVTPITTVYFHPNYNPVNLYNNLAIGRLATSLNFIRAKKRVRRVEYDRATGLMPEKTAVTLLGWGDQKNGETYNGTLTVVDLTTYNLAACQSIYTPQYVTETDFCAGYAGMGACHRDVGGPAFVGSNLVGIVNFGSPMCGNPNGPTVFTKIGNHATWIDSIIAKVRGDISTIPTSPEEKPKEATLMRSRPNTRHHHHKRMREKSTLELLSQVLRDLKLSFLVNATVDVESEYNTKNHPSHKEKTSAKRDHPLKEYLNLWEESKDDKDVIIPIMPIEPEFNLDATPTENPDVTESDLPDLATLPNEKDLDPEIMRQLKEIKRIIDPIISIPAQPNYNLVRFDGKKKKMKTVKSTAAQYESFDKRNIINDVTPQHTIQPVQRKSIPPFVKTMDIDKDSSDMNLSNEDNSEIEKQIDTNQSNDILKNLESTKEVMANLYSDEEYQKRKVTPGAAKKQKHMHFRAEEAEAPVTKLVMEPNDPNNKYRTIVKPMVVPDEGTKVKDRDLDHYQVSEEGEWDDEPTRRLLDYVNI